MSAWFILALIALQAGGGAFAIRDGNYAVAILMAAGVMANVSALMMAARV